MTLYIGVDIHARQQTVSYLDTEDGVMGPTLETTTSHTRELPCLTNEYSVVVSQDDSTITLSQSKAKHVPGWTILIISGGAEHGRICSFGSPLTGRIVNTPSVSMMKAAASASIRWSSIRRQRCRIGPALRTRFGGKPLAVCLEQARAPLIYALLQYDFWCSTRSNPATLAKYRQAFSPALGKDDPTDADYLLDLLQHHRQRLQAWRPDDEKTRTLRFLVEHRRRLINDRTRTSNRLTALLKGYFPQVLG